MVHKTSPICGMAYKRPLILESITNFSIEESMSIFLEGKSVDYVACLIAMVEELWEADIPIDYKELSLIMLKELDQSYDPLVTAQATRIDDVSRFTSLSKMK